MDAARAAYTPGIPPIDRYILHRQEYCRNLAALLQMYELIDELSKAKRVALPPRVQEELRRQVDHVYRLYPAPPYTETEYSELSRSYMGLSLIIEKLDNISRKAVAGLKAGVTVESGRSRPVSQLGVIQVYMNLLNNNLLSFNELKS